MNNKPPNTADSSAAAAPPPKPASIDVNAELDEQKKERDSAVANMPEEFKTRYNHFFVLSKEAECERREFDNAVRNYQLQYHPKFPLLLAREVDKAEGEVFSTVEQLRAIAEKENLDISEVLPVMKKCSDAKFFETRGKSEFDKAKDKYLSQWQPATVNANTNATTNANATATTSASTTINATTNSTTNTDANANSTTITVNANADDNANDIAEFYCRYHPERPCVEEISDSRNNPGRVYYRCTSEATFTNAGGDDKTCKFVLWKDLMCFCNKPLIRKVVKTATTIRKCVECVNSKFQPPKGCRHFAWVGSEMPIPDK